MNNNSNDSTATGAGGKMNPAQILADLVRTAQQFSAQAEALKQEIQRSTDSERDFVTANIQQYEQMQKAVAAKVDEIKGTKVEWSQSSSDRMDKFEDVLKRNKPVSEILLYVTMVQTAMTFILGVFAWHWYTTSVKSKADLIAEYQSQGIPQALINERVMVSDWVKAGGTGTKSFEAYRKQYLSTHTGMVGFKSSISDELTK